MRGAQLVQSEFQQFVCYTITWFKSFIYIIREIGYGVAHDQSVRRISTLVRGSERSLSVI